ISHLGRGKEELEIARQNREVLRDFFGVLKSGRVNDVLKFVFLTGISKFSQVSIFSELNNLDDLSMQESYATILGYEENEIEEYFAEHLQRLAGKLKLSVPEVLEKIREWYDGYRFSDAGVRVYNPFSVLKVLKEGKFKNYWFETATPAFLVNLIKERDYPILELEALRIAPSQFTTYDLDDLALEPLLFQTGYLTIHDYDGLLYELSYPNREVKISFTEFLYNQLVPIGERGTKAQYRLLATHLVKGELEAFIATVNGILSAIPYVHIQGQDEHYYHTVFYLMLTAGGISVHTEVLTSRGRMDMAVETQDRVYVIELKCNQSAAEAIKQIKERGYGERYRGKGKQIILLGINFDTARREVGDWQVEKLD
ncbi:MAG: AAA family ATPase, partial [Calditrichaeota bacterium]